MRQMIRAEVEFVPIHRLALGYTADTWSMLVQVLNGWICEQTCIHDENVELRVLRQKGLCGIVNAS